MAHHDSIVAHFPFLECFVVAGTVKTEFENKSLTNFLRNARSLLEHQLPQSVSSRNSGIDVANDVLGES